jgi:hypothetical protein
LERFALVLGDFDWTDFLDARSALSAKAPAFAFVACHAGKSWSFRLRGSDARTLRF